MDSNNNILLECNRHRISEIEELSNDGFEKLKSSIEKSSRTTANPNFELYGELNQTFYEISLKLKELKLYSEHYYFVSIKDYILYIARQNSVDSTFGHCNFALELLDFFMELFKSNLKFYDSKIETCDEFKRLQKKFKERYWDYRCIFYSDIYHPSGDFTEEEMYELHKSLRDI